MAYTYPFRMASGTSTMLLIDPAAREVIIGVRCDNAWVYPGADSLPGGFMEARYTDQPAKTWRARLHRWLSSLLLPRPVGEPFHEGENLEECAVREIQEELNISVSLDQLHLFTVRSNSRTDTRAHVINACYWLELTQQQSADLRAGDDLKEIKRLPIDDLYLEMPYKALEAKYPMAFNHFEIMMQGLSDWQAYHRHMGQTARIADLEVELMQAQAQITQLEALER